MALAEFLKMVPINRLIIILDEVGLHAKDF